MRVLITDGDTRQALAATRSLGRAGHSVVVATERHPSLASSSRYCDTSQLAPSPFENHEEFAAEIAEIVRRQDVNVVLPMTEVSTFILTRERGRLPTSCLLPFPSHESVLRANDKSATLRLARDLGIPAPVTVEVNSPSIPAPDLEPLTYPIVVKPAKSRVLTSAGWISNSVSFANDANELLRQLESLDAASFPVLLQERIIGTGVGLFMLFDRGNCVAQFSHRRVREKPPSGGVSVLSESIPIDPAAAAYSRMLLSSLKWHGPAMVEFKRNQRDGTLRLMEVNGRFWGSLQLAIDAGIDFPSLLVANAGGAIDAGILPSYRNNVRCRWLAGDLDSLMLVLFKRRRTLNLAPAHPKRLRSVLEFMRFRGSDSRLELERWHDPNPAILEWRRRFFWN